jgi:hypothetical protein
MDFSNFWNLLFTIFWIYAFIAYLIALFAVIGDLFRDHTLGGGFKAIWFILLVFVPFLTVLVYLIARGRGMSERQVAAQKDAQAATNSYIRSVTGGSADEIAKASELLKAGTITQAEFDTLKARALA